jgi:hypothetical protein
MCGKAEFVQDVAHLVVVIALRQAHALWLLLSWLGTLDHDALDGWPHQFHIMALRSLDRQAKRHPMPLGKPAAFHAALAPVGGIGAGFFPRLRERMPHRPVHREPLPVNPAQLLKPLDSCLPQLEEYPCLHPFLKPIMRRRMRTQFGLVKRLPLAAYSQDVKDRVRTESIGHAQRVHHQSDEY